MALIKNYSTAPLLPYRSSNVDVCQESKDPVGYELGSSSSLLLAQIKYEDESSNNTPANHRRTSGLLDDTPMMTPPCNELDDATLKINSRPFFGKPSLEYDASPMFPYHNDSSNWDSLFDDPGPMDVPPLVESTEPTANHVRSENMYESQLLHQPISSVAADMAAISAAAVPMLPLPLTSPGLSAPMSCDAPTICGSMAGSSAIYNSSLSMTSSSQLTGPPYSASLLHASDNLLTENNFQSEEEKAHMKRIRNTMAARRSRARRVEKMADLERRCEVLAFQNHQLELEVVRLRLLLERSQTTYMAHGAARP